MHLILWFLIFISINSTYCAKKSLLTKFEWKYIDFDWQSSKQKQDAIKSGEYDYKNCRLVDVDESADGRIFVTILSGPGSPVALSTISSQCGPGGPLLRPYPDWSWYNKENCTGMTGVLRIAIDKCNRLWVLDTGVLGFDKSICPAQLLAFDLSSDKLIKRIVIPKKVALNATGKGLLTTPIVETYGHKCEDTTIYIADTIGGGLVVVKENNIYRLNNEEFKYEENFIRYEIDDKTYETKDGVLGMALSPELLDGKRYLAFRPFSSRSLYVTNTKSLTPDFGSCNIKYRGIDILPSQATVQAFSAQGTLFYGLTKEVAIGCWNIHKSLGSKNLGIAVVDKEKLQFISGMKIISSHQSERLLVISDRFQLDTLNFNETNFRIMEASVANLIRGTVCDKY